MSTSESMTPTRIETTLLVAEAFRDRGGTEWQPGDRAPLRHRNVRLAALEHPEWFRVEYASEALDIEWCVRWMPTMRESGGRVMPDLAGRGAG